MSDLPIIEDLFAQVKYLSDNQGITDVHLAETRMNLAILAMRIAQEESDYREFYLKSELARKSAFATAKVASIDQGNTAAKSEELARMDKSYLTSCREEITYFSNYKRLSALREQTNQLMNAISAKIKQEQ